jgi:hypothetical protein
MILTNIEASYVLADIGVRSSARTRGVPHKLARFCDLAPERVLEFDQPVIGLEDSRG